MVNNEGTNTSPMLEQLTEDQINALPEAMQAQVRALLNSNKVLRTQLKEKDPSWVELTHTYGKEGKGVVGVKVSRTGAIQITGTRKAYGGLYIFRREMEVILANAAGIVAWMNANSGSLSDEKKPKVTSTTPPSTGDVSTEGTTPVTPSVIGDGEEEETAN